MTLKMSLRHGVCAAALVVLAACTTPQATDQQVDEVPADVSEQITDSMVMAAEASGRSGDWGSAATYWNNLLNKDPTDARYAIGLGTALRHLARYDDSVKVLRDSLVHNPNDPELVAAYGKALLSAGAQLEAVGELQRAAAMTPGDWRIQSALGVAYGMSENGALAEQHYRQALALSPGNPQVLNNYALHKALGGDLATGLQLMEQAASSVDATSQVRQNLALLLAVAGDMPRAEQIVRAELTPEAADRQLAFLETLVAEDLDNLESYVGQGVTVIESEALIAPETGNVVDLTNVEEPETFLTDAGDVVTIEPALEPAIEVEPVPATEPVEDEVPEVVAMETEEVIVVAPVEPAEPEVDAALVIEEEADADGDASGLIDEELSGETLLIVEASDAEDDNLQPDPDIVADPPSPPLEEEVAVVRAMEVVDDEPLPEPAPEPEPAPVPEVVDLPASDGPRYLVQLAALGSQAAAESGVSSLGSQLGEVEGIESLMIEQGTTADGTPTWRIFAGAFAARSDADALCAAIKDSGGDCYVRRE